MHNELDTFKFAADFDQRTIPGDTTTTATIGLGEFVIGVLNPRYDRDWYAIELTADQSIDIDLFGVDPNPNAGRSFLYDPYLRIYDADGQLVDQNDDGGDGYNSAMTFTAQETGTYFLSAGSYFNDSSGLYRLVVEETETAQVIETGAFAYGGLRNGTDTDHYVVDFEAGDEVVIDLRGMDQPNGMEDTVLRVFDAYGTQVAYNNDRATSLDSRIFFTADQAGSYTIEVASGYDDDGGTYRLGVTEFIQPAATDSDFLL